MSDRREVEGTAYIDWSYPNIYASKDRLDRLHIGLSHVRAADDLVIEYDGDRDGWVIRMDRTRRMDGWSEVVEEAVEVAFIPAWNEEP